MAVSNLCVLLQWLSARAGEGEMRPRGSSWCATDPVLQA